MPTTAHRISTVVTPELQDAVQAAPTAELVDDRAGEAERLRAWALYGYRVWLAERAREDKLAGYAEMAGDRDRQDALRAANLQAARAGLL